VNEHLEKILKARYYLPGEDFSKLCWRVARYIGLVDLCYSPTVFRTSHDLTAGGEYNWDMLLSDQLSNYERDMLTRVYNRNVSKMKVDYKKFINYVNQYLSTEGDKFGQVYYDVLVNQYFMPNSPTLMNSNTPLGQLSGCFTLDIQDHLLDIFEMLTTCGMIFRSGGGVGLSFSKLRPEGAGVTTSSGTSSGPISFMRVFDSAIGAVKQGGKRRGAAMAVLHVRHPDILKFIKCKRNEGEFTNFNISVAIDDLFLKAVREDDAYPLWGKEKFPIPSNAPITYRARAVWDAIITSMWEKGEPGVLFIDRINATHPMHSLGEITSTNPCGEVNLLPWESCNLGSVNLLKFVDYETKSFKWSELATVIEIATQFLDNVVDANQYPFPLIERTTLASRKIGLGVMGWADSLWELGIKYNSDKALKLADEVMKFVTMLARRTSTTLALLRDPFPEFEKWDKTKLHLFGLEQQIRDHGIRNATITSLAPTGTISIIAGGVSSGIEPVFAREYIRKDSFGETRIVHPYIDSLKDGLDVPEHCVIASEVPWEYHVRMQAVFQRYTDASISKTINFDHKATKKDIDGALQLAFDLGCKGLTVYREGTRNEIVLSKIEQKEEPKVTPQKENPEPQLEVQNWKRPDELDGKTIRVKTAFGNIYITVNRHPSTNLPIEVFCTSGKSGGEQSAWVEAVSRLISKSLQNGVSIEEVIHQLRSIRSTPTWDGKRRIESGPDAIAYVLEKSLGKVEVEVEHTQEEVPVKAEDIISLSCPQCGGGPVVKLGTCGVCHNCGYSVC